MSSTTPTSDSSDSTTTPNAASIQFCNDLLTSPTLANAFYAEITTASQNQTYETEIIDNWLVAQGYQCTIEQVLAAQKQLPTYQLYYWSGAYNTLIGTSKQAGPILTIHAYQSGEQQIGYGQMWVIDPSFSNLVLSWSSDGGLNSNSASLAFTLTAASDGTATQSFYGTITDSKGNQQSIAGAMMSTAQVNAASNAGKVPPGQNMSNLQIAQTTITFFAQTTFLLLNFYQLYKTQQEVTLLKQQLAEKSSPETEEELEENESEMSDLQDTQTDAMDVGEDISEEFNAIPASNVETLMGQCEADNDATPLDVPEDAPEATAEQQDLLNEAVDEEAEEEAQADDDEGDETADEDDDDLDDIFDGIDETI